MGTEETWKLLEGTQSILRHCPVVTTAGAQEMTWCPGGQVRRGCFPHHYHPHPSLDPSGTGPTSHKDTHRTWDGTGVTSLHIPKPTKHSPHQEHPKTNATSIVAIGPKSQVHCGF